MDAWLQKYVPKYQLVVDLLDSQVEKTLKPSENSKDVKIFQNQYKAKEILDDLLNSLENLQVLDDEQFVFKKSVLFSLFYYQLGLISVETEELSSGENYLLKALNSIKGLESKTEGCILAICTRNQLGILWSERNEHEKACEYLVSAAKIYDAYKVSSEHPPVPLNELFGFLESSTCSFDRLDNGFGKCHVHTLYYLAQVYRHMDNSEEAAIHCHKTLKWQIENKDFEPMEWSLNCAALAQFFICQNNFTVARYFLGCASYMMNKIQIDEVEKEIFTHTKADIARCWAAYGISFLSFSQEKLGSETSNGTSDSNSIPKLTNSFAAICNVDDFALFEDNIGDFENQITCQCVQNFEEAKKIFLATQSWLNEAKEYYTLNEYASDYVKIIQDTSKLYKTLTFFETGVERKCKMHKRRADLLEEALKSLNPQYWLSVVRQLLFELGELYSEMMDLKYKERDEILPHAMKKINALSQKSTKHFQSFLDTFKVSEELPQKYPEDYVRPALLAHFYIARLYSKLITTDTQKGVENLKLSKMYYDYIDNYVLKNPDDASCIEEELELVHELQQLIPGKMQRLASSCIY